VFSLALVALKFKPNLAHPLATLARPDFVLLFALGSSFSTSLLVHLLLAAKTLLLETLDDVDGATPLQRSFASGVRLVFHVVELEAVHAADLETTGTGQRSCMGERSRAGAESDAQWARGWSDGTLKSRNASQGSKATAAATPNRAKPTRGSNTTSPEASQVQDQQASRSETTSEREVDMTDAAEPLTSNE
jgi:hypothetical protein